MGGVGASLVQVARALGAGQVIAVDVRDEKLQAARSLGATDVVNSTKTDAVQEIMKLTNGRGVDVTRR